MEHCFFSRFQQGAAEKGLFMEYYLIEFLVFLGSSETKHDGFEKK